MINECKNDNDSDGWSLIIMMLIVLGSFYVDTLEIIFNVVYNRRVK